MNNLLNASTVFLKRNSSTILTCIGAIGVVVTSVMAVKATPKAMRIVEQAKEEKQEKLTKFETFKAVAPVYIPATIVGLSTIACIFLANILNKRSQASLICAYALLNNSYKYYKNKVEELYGEGANKKIREEIAKDKYEDINRTEGKQLFYDFYSGRYFESTIETVRRAEYETNRSLSLNGEASLNEFYKILNLPHDSRYDELGWSAAQIYKTYRHPWIEFDHEDFVGDDGLECCIIYMPLEPLPGYLDY